MSRLDDFIANLSMPDFAKIGLLLFGSLLYYLLAEPKRGPPLPPGPRPFPILGNIFDFPPKGVPEYVHWLDHKNRYGDITSVTVLGQPMILIHDKEAAHELLDRQSIKTAMRPLQRFARYCGFGTFLTFRQYDETFRFHRKLIHQQMGTSVYATRFHGTQDIESRRLLLRTMKEPQKLIAHIRTEAAAIILKITYGYTIEPHKMDPLVLLVEHAMSLLAKSMLPLTWILDVLPFLKYVPEGLPGTSFKKTAREWRKVVDKMAELPYLFAREQMEEGTNRSSYVSFLVDKYGTRTDDGSIQLQKSHEEAIMMTAATLYGGGADTTFASLQSFILAMIMFPHVQEKAQEEIDRVVGTARLPSFDDRNQLPYIDALVTENFRWFPALPIGLPHMTNDEIMYKGWTIPKGSILMAAVWWFLNDPKTHPDPDEFEPERFLAPRNEPDPKAELFGYGRRACPGKYVAVESLFITIARMLAVFKISKGVDASGREVEPIAISLPGLLNLPAPFPFKIEPRSEKHAELIRSVEIDHPWEPSDSRHLPKGVVAD